MTPDELEARLTEFEERIKEREVSVFRGLKTFVEDCVHFSRGERDFPQAALIGLVFSYLRHRGIVLVFGGVLAGVLALIQVYLLFTQNGLIEAQNQTIKAQNQLVEAQNRLGEIQTQQASAQAEASQLQAVSFLISSIDPTNTSRTELAVAQLSEYGMHGVAALLRLAAGQDDLSAIALRALFGQHQLHTPEQVLRTFTAWQQRLMKVSPALSSEASNDQVIIWLWKGVDSNRVFPDLQASIEYFEGLIRRLEKGGPFASTLRESIKREPTALLNVLEAGYESVFKDARKHGITVKQNSVSAVTSRGQALWNWHVTVYSFCRAIAGQKIPQVFEIPIFVNEEITGPWLQIQETLRKRQDDGMAVIYNDWLAIPDPSQRRK